MKFKDTIKVYTAEFDLVQYLIIIVAGYKQVCDYYIETFIVREDDTEYFYEQRDEDKAVEGNSHEEKCNMLIQQYFKFAKNRILSELKEKHGQDRKNIDNLKEDDGEWLKYLYRNSNTRSLLIKIRARTYSDDLKSMLSLDVAYQ